MKTIMVIAALAAMPAAVAAQTLPEDVLGAWTTPLAEQRTGGGASGFVRERIVFDAEENTVVIEAFADAEGAVPLFTYESAGPYAVGEPVAGLPGASALDARNLRSTVTVHADAAELWEALNLGACDLAIGVAVDISGCVSGPPLNAADCVELDLVAVDAGGLRLGARDVDRCVERPTALGAVVYRRE